MILIAQKCVSVTDSKSFVVLYCRYGRLYRKIECFAGVVRMVRVTGLHRGLLRFCVSTHSTDQSETVSSLGRKSAVFRVKVTVRMQVLEGHLFRLIRHCVPSLVSK